MNPLEQDDFQKPASSASNAGDMRETSSIATQTYDETVGRKEKVALES